MRRVLFFFLLAAALAGPGITGIGGAEAAEATVTFTDRANPATLDVASGTTVTFANQSGERRRVRSKDGPEEFDSGNIEPGDSWSVVLHGAGNYPYVDERDHDDTAFHGTITVGAVTQSAGGSAGAPAGSSPPSGSPAPSAPTTASVAILDRSFSPATATVAPGGTVSWTNQSDRDHTATGAGFDSGVLGGGGRFSHTFPSAGTFAYICDIHPEMRASVTVTSSAGTPPPVSPAAGVASPAPPAPAPGPAASPPGTPTTPGTAGGMRHGVAVVDYAFRPATLSARAGDTVVWINQGRAPHTATATGLFDTGMFRAGEQRTTTLSTAGTFTFRCTVHPEMTGVLRVASAAAGPAPPAAPGIASTLSDATATGDSSATTTAPTMPGIPPEEEATATAAQVSVVDFAFEPAAVRLTTGGTVTWRLTGTAPHTVSAGDGSFDSGLLEPGAIFSHRFDEAGSYQYICAFHPQMTATVEVVEAAASVADGSADAGGEQAADLTGGTQPVSTSRGSVLAGLFAVAALLAGTGALLYGGSRMVAAGEGG